MHDGGERIGEITFLQRIAQRNLVDLLRFGRNHCFSHGPPLNPSHESDKPRIRGVALLEKPRAVSPCTARAVACGPKMLPRRRNFLAVRLGLPLLRRACALAETQASRWKSGFACEGPHARSRVSRRNPEINH